MIYTDQEGTKSLYYKSLQKYFSEFVKELWLIKLKCF